jgi:molybdate transport system ATP-binding protein
MNLEFRLSYRQSSVANRSRSQDEFVLSGEETWSGDLNVLTGASGSGKTTLLNLLAGIAKPQTGFIRLNHQCLVDTQSGVFIPAQKRKIAYVFQDNLLFPHMSVQKNIAYGWSGEQKQWDRIRALGIARLLDRFPHELSGGEQRRVAIARAMMGNPELLLLDEPFTGLNESLRVALKETLVELQTTDDLGLIIVTHDHSNLFADLPHHIHHLEAGTLRSGRN